MPTVPRWAPGWTPNLAPRRPDGSHWPAPPGGRALWLGCLALTLLSFFQPPGRIAADTKFDLTANPGGFLRGALHVWTDAFPLGQMQNQAYGYLFPQGLFFWLADLASASVARVSPAPVEIPSWLAQRVWWALLLCLAYSGTLILARRLGITLPLAAVAAASLYALSPRILTTLTAISSEAWPVALVPWTLIPLVPLMTLVPRGLRRTPTWPRLAAAVLPVAAMGGVNATATAAACLPAAIYLLARGRIKAAIGFTLGALAVSAWWIGPLFVLGHYSPPFTEFIESATVTTSWLSPVEILRGATSWAPFVDAERTAGFLLVGEPTFIIATCAVAALGLAGLARADFPQRHAFVVMFSVGFAILASAHMGISLYDAPLAPLRNLHKFDPLVRLPLTLGVGWLFVGVHRSKTSGAAARGTATTPTATTQAKTTAALLAAAIAIAPAWSLRLLPEGTWRSIPEDWIAAGQWLDQHAAHTRTLVVPAVPFARQEWGWTRDEPIQALTSSRFAFRDAIPLVDPEAIRGLDGQVGSVDTHALRAIGVGAVIVRHDLEKQPDTPDLGEPSARFGALDVHLLEPARDMMITGDAALPVDAGGEALPLLWRELGYFPAQLTGADTGTHHGTDDPAPAIITDTPALAARNYGTLNGAQSAHLVSLDEDTTVHNRLKDYPSAGRRTGVSTFVTAVEDAASSEPADPADISVRASSSAADAGAFGGAQASKSLTAAFDGIDDTAWWPAPGDGRGWIEFSSTTETISITATEDTTVTVTTTSTPPAADDAHVDQPAASSTREVSLVADQPRTFRVSTGPASTVRVALTEPVGIAEIDAGIRRIVNVEGTADAYFFQRLFPATDVMQRRFTTATDARWQLSAPATIDGTEHAEGATVALSAGPHELITDAETILLTSSELALPGWKSFDGTVEAAATPRTIVTTRGFNEGLRARVGEVELVPTRVDASTQAFLLPPNLTGEFVMYHAGDAPYRRSLAVGGAVSLLTALLCAVFAWRHRGETGPAAAGASAQPGRSHTVLTVAVPTLAAVAAGPVAGVPAAVLAWVVRRFTLIPSAWLTGGALTFAGCWLARAPWPAANYAGDSWLLAVAGCFAVACLGWPDAPSDRTSRAPGTSTSS